MAAVAGRGGAGVKPAFCPWHAKPEWIADTDGTQVEAYCCKCKRVVVGRVDTRVSVLS